MSVKTDSHRKLRLEKRGPFDLSHWWTCGMSLLFGTPQRASLKQGSTQTTLCHWKTWTFLRMKMRSRVSFLVFLGGASYNAILFLLSSVTKIGYVFFRAGNYSCLPPENAGFVVHEHKSQHTYIRVY